jgi:hypothetical protein
MNGTEFADRWAVKFDWRATGYQRDESGWEHHAYVITLTNRDGDTVEVPWRQGLAVDNTPVATDVLWALGRECATFDQAPSFDEYADEFGYDTDSRRAYAEFEAVRAQRERIYAWCVSEQMYDDFTELDEEE